MQLSLSLSPHIFFFVIILYLYGLDLLLRYYNEQLMDYQLQYMPKKFVWFVWFFFFCIYKEFVWS